MSASIQSCCTPVAAAPVATPQTVAVDGGGAPAKGDDTVSGGGSTGYDASTAPTGCGQWVPAPVVVSGNEPTVAPTTPTTPTISPDSTGGTDAPPAPIDTPNAPTTGTSATTPASQLATWPQWQQQFAALKLSNADIAKIGAANLTDQQLAQVYEKIYNTVVESGGTPGTTSVSVDVASAWTPEWDQKFAALGVPAALIAELKAQAVATGADDAAIQKVYDQLVADPTGSKIAGTGTSAWDPEWDQKFAALGLPADFIAELKAQATASGADDATIQKVYDAVAAKVKDADSTNADSTNADSTTTGAGWNATFEQQFRALGMPDDVISLYANSGAPASGLEKAYEHAKSRVDDFTNRGWMQKFTEAGVPASDMWQLILGPQVATDDECNKAVENARASKRSIWQTLGQGLVSLFPGGRLVEYAIGREAVTGNKIDQKDPMQIGMALLSGVAAFAAIRGGRSVLAGISARNGNYAALNGVSTTLEKLGLPKAGVAGMEQTAMGATQTWGWKQKLLAWIPGTSLHREVVGLGHAEAAARAFNAGAAEKIFKNQTDGALKIAGLTQMFDDIKSGAVRMSGGTNAYFPQFRNPSLVTTKQLKNGVELLKFAKNLGIGNGNAQLVGLMQTAGTKISQNPEWLKSANVIGAVEGLDELTRSTLSTAMASSLAKDLGPFSFKDGLRQIRGLNVLAKNSLGDWYNALGAAAKSAKPLPAISADALQIGAQRKIVDALIGEGRDAIAKLDRSKLSAEASKLVDDLAARTDQMDSALATSVKAGKLDAAFGTAQKNWETAVSALGAHDDALAKQLVPTVTDEAAMRNLIERAQTAAKSELLRGGVAPVTHNVVAPVAPVATSEAATRVAATVADDGMLTKLGSLDQMTGGGAAHVAPAVPKFADDPFGAMEHV